MASLVSSTGRVGGAGGPRELEIVYAECGERRLVLIDASVAFEECLPCAASPPTRGGAIMSGR